MGAADHPAFESLFRETYPSVAAYCHRRLPPVEADEAVAEVYEVAWAKRDMVLAADVPLAWLYRVAFGVVSNAYRSKRRKRQFLQRVEAERRASPPTPENRALESEETNLVLRALGELSSDDQEILRLAAFEGLAYAEISTVLQIPEGAVRSRLHRARRRLGAVLAEAGS